MGDKFGQLKADVQSHGEVHVILDEVGEKEIRRGQADFDKSAGLITVDDGRRIHRVAIDDIAYWYKPMEF